MPASTNGDALVLSTVNAPYRRVIDGDTLATCLRTGMVDGWLVHVATLFVDVRPGLVVRFAEQHDIGMGRLSRTYREVRDATGERSPPFEAAIVSLANAPRPDLRGPDASG